jgi:UDP-glucose 4-epimerase
VNITGTVRVLEAARDAGVRRVMFASSAAVYGQTPRLPSREIDPIDCWSPYAASKAAGEAAMRAFAHCYDLDSVSLRYFNIFGPRQDPKSAYAAVIAAFADALKTGRTPVINGDGGQTRDFAFVGDVVRANLLAAARETPFRGEVLNIGTGSRTSLTTLLTTMSDVLGVKVSPEFRPPRAGDVRDSAADIAQAREQLGYEPQFDLKSGLRALLSRG